MRPHPKRPDLARTDRILPGVWRIRLPLPWPGVPHGNAFAAAYDGGIVLFDTGIGGPGALALFEGGLAQAGFVVEDVKLVVCTHAHADHYGLAGTIVDRAGCELWMHPAWGHAKGIADQSGAALERRIEVARQSGVPAPILEIYKEDRQEADPTIDRLAEPDRDLLPGVEVETDLGNWQVYETPGHAPSHVVLHQPERKLLISGDHLLGRIALFFDYGHTPDPVGEFITSLDTVGDLEVGLCLAGHGRPFRDVPAKIAAMRVQLDDHLDRIRGSLASAPKTAFGTIPDLMGPENVNPATATLGLQLSLAYLDHLAVLGEARKLEGSDPVEWEPTGAAKA